VEEKRASLSARSREETRRHITRVHDNAQMPCTRMLVRKDVAEETKERLLAIRAGRDMTGLLHRIFLCQDQLDEIAKKGVFFGDQETWRLRDYS